MIFNSALTIICMRTFNGTFSPQRIFELRLCLCSPRMGSRREAETFLLSAKPPMMLIWSLKGEEDMVSPVRLVTMVSRSSDDSLSTCDTRLEPEAAR